MSGLVEERKESMAANIVWLFTYRDVRYVIDLKTNAVILEEAYAPKYFTNPLSKYNGSGMNGITPAPMSSWKSLVFQGYCS